MENPVVKLCIICGVEEPISDKVGDYIPEPLFSKNEKLGKFCAELELSSLSLSLRRDDIFTACNFLQQLDNCGNFVKICEECSVLISETVDKRVQLEEVECSVLELQIKLLLKLKELEGCTQAYSREMGRMMEKIKGSQVDSLERNTKIFGRERSKCDVLGFRKRILNVATSLQIFQDSLADKLVRNGDEDDNDDNHFHNLSLSPMMSSPKPFEENYEDNCGSTQNLEKLKLEEFDDDPQDNLANLKEEIKTNENVEDKPVSIPKRKRSRRKAPKISQNVQWSSMGPLKTFLINCVLNGQKSFFGQYKWTYSVPTDQLKFADNLIQITELENDGELINGERRLTLCCIDNHEDNPGFQVSHNFPSQLNCRKDIENGVYLLKKKMRDHVLSFHLDVFTCPEEGCQLEKKLVSLRMFKEHLATHQSSNICEICGKDFSQRKGLLRHRKIHEIKIGGQVKAEKERNFLCNVCGKGFTKLIICRTHEESHKPKELRAKVTCSFCGKEVLKRCYSMHKNLSCPEQARNKRMDCRLCGKSYKSRKSLGDHLVRTHKMKERPKLKD